MARYGKHPERSRVSGDLEKLGENMDEKHEEMEKPTTDVEVEDETLRSLEGGTQEGFEGAVQEIQQAQDVSTQEFEEDSGELDEIHAEGEEFEGEMDEQSDIVTSDQEKIADASERLHSDAARNELKDADAVLEEDKEFVKDHGQRSEKAREDSDRFREEMRQRIDNARSS